MFKWRRTSKPEPATVDGHAKASAALTSDDRDLAVRPGLPSFAPRQQVADRYCIEQLLGHGAMGEVYEARDEELSIPVALKLLRWDVGREREALWRLKREVLLARSVAHPNVCRVYDLGRHGGGPDGRWFLTMELLRGETLRERLQRVGRFTPDKALPLVKQMAAGLEAAHRAGVVHRDFKSGNVMLVRGAEGERAVVTDFGLARPVGTEIGDKAEQTQSGAFVGTPAFMAPEQVRGDQVGPAADIYALGVVLYQMTTGTLPFTGRTVLEAAVKRLVETPPSPRGVVAELDERWEAVILRCLAREPEGRFGRAEEVADVLSGQAPVVAVELPGISRVRHALPAERDVFVGREAELERLDRELAEGSCLVTLHGVAGMGKTRLAVRYGWRSLQAWPGGVWFCDLTEARSRDGIASAVAGTLGVQLGKGDPMEQLGHAIAGRKRCLLILDNFEQVVENAQETLGRWLERAPEARFLVTTRARLNLRGEKVQEVEPLPLDSGTEMFVERARHQRPGLELKGLELQSVREVVSLMEGMPLGIELAAARMRVMTVGQVMERMRERFRLLGGEGGGRHASLRAALDNSWELLRPWEQAAWTQCSVFEGGFTLEAAENVLDLTKWSEAPWVVDVVQSLVDKSLLRMWVPEDRMGGVVPDPRFGMFMSLQEYAREKLSEEGQVPEEASVPRAELAAKERHGRWYARYGTEEAIESLSQRGGVERLRRLGRELENLVAACRRAVDRSDGETAVAAYRAAWEVLELRGPFAAAVELGRVVVGGPPLGHQGLARALRTLGQAEWRSGRMEVAGAHLVDALACARQAGDRRSEGVVLISIGNVHARQGRVDEAITNYEAALAAARETGDRRTERFVLSNLGLMYRDRSRTQEARAHYEAALAIAQQAGDRRCEGTVLNNLGDLCAEQGRIREACTQLETALPIAREVGDRRSESLVLCNLGELHREHGRLKEAGSYLEAALAGAQELGERRFEGIVLRNLGRVDREQGRNEAARANLEAALAIAREVGDRRTEGTVLGDLGELDREQGLLKEARAHYEAALTSAQGASYRRLEGIFLGQLGVLGLDQGHPEEARVHLQSALAIACEVGDQSEEGMLLGMLGSLHLMEGRIKEAREALTQGESLLREVGSRIKLGKLLCVRAELEWRTANRDRASASLYEAEAIADQVGAGPDSELRRRMAKLRPVIASTPESGAVVPPGLPD